MRLRRRNPGRIERLRRRAHEVWTSVFAAVWLARRFLRHGRGRVRLTR